MGGVSRFIMLLTRPFPSLFHPLRPCPSVLCIARHTHLSASSFRHLHHRHRHRPFHLTTLSSISLAHPPQLLFSKSKFSRAHLYIQSQFSTPEDAKSPNSLASNTWPPSLWPEFSKLLHAVARQQQSAAVGTYDASPDDAFVASEDLPHEFLPAARTCLAFSRNQSDLLRSLSRRDMDVVVANGTPFLFKSALDSARRMKEFLANGGSTVSESDKAHTVDLMKYLLSYAINPSVSSESSNMYSRELITSSCRNLLNELAAMSQRLSTADLSAPQQYQFSGGYGQMPRPFGQNIEMKRGDWICPKCSFMNFARNVKCLECEEPRPQKQLTGGEWECPQCDFFNYGRNLVCLRCDWKRPGEMSLGTVSSRSGLEYGNGDYANKADVDSRLAGNEDRARRWFSKVSQLNAASDLSSVAAEEDFPEIMPLRKGVNRFVMSTRKTPLERKLANSQHQRNLGNDVLLKSNHSQTDSARKNVDTSVRRSLDQILGHTSTMSEADGCGMTAGQNVGTESSNMPSGLGSPQHRQHQRSNSTSVPSVPVRDELRKSGEHILYSEKPEMHAQSLDKGSTQAEKSERWFRRVAELHDVKDLTSAISDDDFPEIMPMRKGENRFVVGKKKDRSLTSPMYKRQMAMEQANSSNYVPFVPFPPDYFAKDKQEAESPDSTMQSTAETTSSVKPEESDNMNSVQRKINQETNSVKWNSNSLENSGTGMNGNSAQNSYSTQMSKVDSWISGFSEKANSSESINMSGSSSQLPKNQNVGAWTGKSLEGSAVKEPDPLDMSEEAKAERWFRRVAQIKDISELSQIPDEDFPSIMPMRKGVNRFVVSKRKTPLERRLTSPQYRRNLPIVSSNPVEKENDSS